MPERIVCCVAGMLCAMVGFIALGQTPAVGQEWWGHDDRGRGNPGLDRRLAKVLAAAGFTGSVESRLEVRLGRPLDPALADLGRLLFFDKILGLHDDNSCAGCHSPAFGFGDSQPMAIGVDNNDIVGPSRHGPRNQRRSPLVANTIFYPALMWTPRFVALSGDPFDPSLGFQFPPPELVIVGAPTLLAAQGSLPSTELVEMAGFTGITDNPGPFGPRRDGLPQFPHPGRRRRAAQYDARLPRKVRRGL
jgi:cytochrome c peroxidase